MRNNFGKLALAIVVVMAGLVTGCPPLFGDDGTVITVKNETSAPIKVDVNWTYEDDAEPPSVRPYHQSKSPVIDPTETEELLTLIEPERHQGICCNYYITVITESGMLWQKIFSWDALDEMDWTIVVEVTEKETM